MSPGVLSKSGLRAIICPSILNSDLAKLGEECERMLKCGADWLHLDVMDGHFVPNLSFGPPVVQALRRRLGNEPFFDVHLMVSQPQRWLEPMRDAGADQFTFHVEAFDNEQDVADLIQNVGHAGMKVGLAVKPGTAAAALLPFCEQIDTVLVMTVEPGFGGQKFMAPMMAKVSQIRRLHPQLNIQVDGGVGPSTIELCSRAGANLIVSGTAVVRSDEPEKAITLMRESVERAISIGKF